MQKAYFHCGPLVKHITEQAKSKEQLKTSLTVRKVENTKILTWK